MFGFVAANPERLTDEQKIRYKAIYCGVCEELGERGFTNRMTLTYDLVFLAVFISSVIAEEYNEYEAGCPVHPLKKRKFLRNAYTGYAADMNIALAYHKYLDDWEDDRSYPALMKSKLFSKEIARIEKRYPLQCKAIKECLDELHDIEREGILIPDIPADVFGRLLGAVFVPDDIPQKAELYDFGFTLGKFIYILDAAVDLNADIKKQKYNPLIRYSFDGL